MAELKIFLCLNLVLLAYRPADGYQKRNLGSRLGRYLMYNPADMSTAIGYKNHTIHNMGSLVNEASSQAHGGAGSSPYNVPNFPAMGNNGGQQGSSSNLASGTSGSGSASFAGTNQWRCDSHVVAQCDTQCLDVDPKDGCPFCIPGCTGAQSTGSASQSGSSSSSSSGNQPFNSAGTSSQSGSTGGSSASGSSGGSSGSGLSGAGSPFGSGTPASAPFGGQVSSGLSQSAGTLSGTGSSLQGTAGQNPGTLTGTSGQGSQSGGSLGQLPSGLAGTGSNGQGTSGTGASSGTSCPYYPPNCPKTFTKLENGCLTCTLLQQLNIKPSQALSTSVPTTSARVTCPPTRCVAPCNKGIVLAADGCPRCKCPAYT